MEQPPDPFDRLPDEVFQLIFGAIQDCQALVSCMAVSRAFRAQAVRVPTLSIVCPGSFSSYDAKLRGVYMMVKEFICLESLVVRVGQPKEEPPSWARCMRYAEIGASVEKFVFMAAKSGDFAELDVELAEGEAISERESASSLDRQRENSWELWREQLLSGRRASSSRSEDEPNEDMSRRGRFLGDNASALHLEMDTDITAKSELCSSLAADSPDTSQRERAQIGASNLGALHVDCHTTVAQKQETASSGTEQEVSLSSPCQASTSQCHDLKRDAKLKGLQEDVTSSSMATAGMLTRSSTREGNEMERLRQEASSSRSGDCTESSFSLQGQAPQGEGLSDPQGTMTQSLDDPSSDAVIRDLQNSNARYLYRRGFPGHGRYSYEGWDFVRERCKIPDFALRQVIAPSNDVLKRMVPVIVFAIVQGLDEFRDSVPMFIAKFVKLKRFVLVDMVESVTVYMREHQIQEIRDQGAPQREGLREGQSSGTQAADSERGSYAKECRTQNPDVRDVENLPDFPLGTEVTPDRDKCKKGRRRISGKALKESRMKGIDLGYRTVSDSGKQKLPMSEDDCKDQDFRRWKGKGIVPVDEPLSHEGSLTKDVRHGSGDSTVGNQDADTPMWLAESGAPECPKLSHAQGKRILSRLSPEPPAVDYGSDLSDISVCVNCGLSNNRRPCQSVDCPRLSRTTGRKSGKQHVICDTEVIDGELKLAFDDEAGATCIATSESYISLKDLGCPDRVPHVSGSVDGASSANQNLRSPVANTSGSSRAEESCEASSSVPLVRTDAPSKHGVAGDIIDGETSTEPGSESEKKGRPWFQYFVGLKPERETLGCSQLGGGEAPSLGALEGEGQVEISGQAVKKVVRPESQRPKKESRNSRRSREDIRGFSLRRSQRMVAERTAQRLRQPFMPAPLVVDQADNWGGAHVDELDPEILSSGTERSGGEMEGRAEPRSENTDVAVLKSLKGKQVMEEDGEDSEDSRCDLLPGGSSTSQARWNLSSCGSQETTSMSLPPLQPFTFQEQVQIEQQQSSEIGNNESVSAPPSPAGPREASQARGHTTGLGWIQLREATRGDRPRIGYLPFDRLPRDKSNDRDVWRQRVGRRARDYRRDAEADRERRERMREGARKRQRDIETEALYFDISFWRAEQVVAQSYSLSDVSMCVATHCANPLTAEELDILSKAALAGPLLTATMGYVNKQVGSHNL